jgi:hypothetical protein
MADIHIIDSEVNTFSPISPPSSITVTNTYDATNIIEINDGINITPSNMYALLTSGEPNALSYDIAKSINSTTTRLALLDAVNRVDVKSYTNCGYGFSIDSFLNRCASITPMRSFYDDDTVNFYFKFKPANTPTIFEIKYKTTIASPTNVWNNLITKYNDGEKLAEILNIIIGEPLSDIPSDITRSCYTDIKDMMTDIPDNSPNILIISGAFELMDLGKVVGIISLLNTPKQDAIYAGLSPEKSSDIKAAVNFYKFGL